MSFIETDGRSPRFLTRAQKWAITNESAPSSSKKWLSTDTRSTCRTPASTSARMLSAPVVTALGRSSTTVDSATAVDSAMPVMSCESARHCPAHRAISQNSSHDLVEEVGQAQALAGGDGLVVHPLADRHVEYPHAEGGENDRTATIH